MSYCFLVKDFPSWLSQKPRLWSPTPQQPPVGRGVAVQGSFCLGHWGSWVLSLARGGGQGRREHAPNPAPQHADLSSYRATQRGSVGTGSRHPAAHNDIPFDCVLITEVQPKGLLRVHTKDL